MSISIPRLFVIKNPVYTGNYALKATVLQGDLVNQGARAEVVFYDSQSKKHIWEEGDEVWYHWQTMFPNDLSISPGKWLVWTQWHHNSSSGSPPLAIAINENGGKQYLNLKELSRTYDNAGCFNFTIQCGYLWIEELKKDVWYDIFLHVKWSQNSNGFVELWINNKHVLPKLYHPNLYPHPENGVYMKQGLYREKSITEQQSIYHDDMKIIQCQSLTCYYLDFILSEFMVMGQYRISPR